MGAIIHLLTLLLTAGLSPVVFSADAEDVWDRVSHHVVRNGDIKIDMPVLQFHGLKDTAVDKDGLKGTWDWIDQDYTLVTIPSSGHFVQWEAAGMVSQTMKVWLNSRD